MSCHPANNKQYICPGETRPISRAVHLSRLAAFYPACRDCALRHETGQLSTRTVERIEQTNRRAFESRLFASEGVRGIHLNEVTRLSAGRMAAAFAQLVWKTMPTIGRNSDRQRMPQQRRPTFVVARDHRVGAPDIMVGVIASLIRMGCDVIDIGEATNAIVEFTINHLNVTGGIVVSGSGCGPSWVGLDFYSGPYLISAAMDGRSANETSARISLDQIEQQYRSPGCRPVRTAGTCRTFLARIPYEAGLLKHFASHTERFCVATSRTIVKDTIASALRDPQTATFVELPVRSRSFVDADDPDVIRLANSVRESRSAFGVLIDDDGQRCAVVDHTGELLNATSVLAILADAANAIQPGSAVVVEETAYQQVRDILCDHPCYVSAQSRAEMRRRMQLHQAAVGGGHSHRYWLDNGQCDAIVTLATLIKASASSARPLRSVADEIVFDRAA